MCSFQNLSKASGLSKKKVEKFLQTKTSYTKIGPPIRSFRRLQAFSKYINEIWCMDLAFVDKFASQNNGVKYLLVAVDIGALGRLNLHAIQFCENTLELSGSSA